jgi:CHAD domain-containing protein/transposase-like protein
MTGQLLNPEQISILNTLSKNSESDKLRRRARILLLYNNGRSTVEISQEVGLSQSTVRSWRRKFFENGMAIFPESRSSSRPKDTEPENKQIPKPHVFYRADVINPEVKSDIPQLPRVTKKAGIKPDDDMSEAGRKIFTFQFAHLLDHESGTLLGEDIEELHDMRVASRRLRAAFDVFGPFFRSKDVRRHLKGLRETGRALGRVRDLDVFMEKAQRYLEKLSIQERTGLDPLLQAWSQRRSKARDKMVAYLGSSGYRQFKQEFNQFIAVRPFEGVPAAREKSRPKLVRYVTPVLIYQNLSEVRSYDVILKNPAIEQLHALRIAFKKLRYVVEFFSEVMGPQAKEVVGELKTLQDHLGDLNDADVACQILREFIETWELRQTGLPLQDRQNPEPVVAYLASKHAELHKLMISFPEAWARFNRPELMTKLALAISIL